MNIVVKRGLYGGLGMGIATGAIGYFLTPAMEQSEADQVRAITACAQHMSDEVAPIQGDLPKDCEYFSSAIGDYYLPARDDFTKRELANITTDEEQKDLSIKMGLVLGGIGLLGGAVMWGTYSRPRRDEDTN
jgi:hypothetical protein